MTIKNLQNNFTTPEQSKRLLELGVPADSADCIYYDEGLSPSTLLGYNGKQFLYSEIQESGKELPCWSVGRLIEIDNICSIPKIKEAGFHLMRTDFDDLIETMIVSIKMKVEHGWIVFSKLEE